MRRYAITDRQLFPGSESDKRHALVAQAARLSAAGVEYLQVREKDLPASELWPLVVEMRDAVTARAGETQVVLNGPAAMAREAGVGLHLPASAIASHDLSRVVSASCHTLAEIETARSFADVLLFGPVFEKRVAGERVQDGAGLEALALACTAARGVPVFALGGVTLQNVQQCLFAGAAGIAGIRLFLD